jgi:hypothetical protein
MEIQLITLMVLYVVILTYSQFKKNIELIALDAIALILCPIGLLIKLGKIIYNKHIRKNERQKVF